MVVGLVFFLFVFACPLSATTVHGFIDPPSRACQTIQILVLVVGGFKAVLDGTLSRRCRENNAFMCLNFILFLFLFFVASSFCRATLECVDESGALNRWPHCDYPSVAWMMTKSNWIANQHAVPPFFFFFYSRASSSRFAGCPQRTSWF